MDEYACKQWNVTQPKAYMQYLNSSNAVNRRKMYEYW